MRCLDLDKQRLFQIERPYLIFRPDWHGHLRLPT
jgi:hypothetical protein